MQPQAVEIEKAVLGALIVDKTAILEVINTLYSECFYLAKHQYIWNAIKDCYEQGNPIDLLTVKNQLEKEERLNEVGGVYYLVELTNQVASAANIEYHAFLLRDKAILRQAIVLGHTITREASETGANALKIAQNVQRAALELTSSTTKGGFESLSSITGKMQEEMTTKRNQESGLNGVPTGFAEFDQMTNGWQAGDLIIIAARPAMGKSGLALKLAYNAATNGKAVGIVSLEMPKIQNAQRLISQASGVGISKIRKAEMESYEWQKLTDSSELLVQLPIYIDDTPSMNIFELQAKASRMKAQGQLDMLVIDYLQLMTSSQKNREQEIAAISRKLKEIAKELEIPVIALAQLSRAVENRGGAKRPQLSDLRESGAIEQDADMVSFIYRPEYYGINEDEEGQSLAGVAEVIVAKHRNGPTGTVKLQFIAHTTDFTDLQPNFDTGEVPNSPF